MTQRSRPFVRRLRYVLMATLLLMLGGLVGLFYFGSAGEPADLPSEEAETGAGATRQEEWEEGTSLQSEGFEFTLQQEGRPVFRIRGDATRSDRDENVFLEKVVIILPREGGDYELQSDEATYDQRRHEAKLEGNVHLDGPQDLKLDTRWLELRQGGRILVASQGSDFGVGDHLVGQAQNLRMDLDQDVVVLSGGVEMGSPAGSETEFSLTARRVILEKRERRLMAEGKVVIDRGPEHLEADRLSLFLDEDLEKVRFLRGLRHVKGRVLPPLDPGVPSQTLTFRGNSLSLLFDAETNDPLKMELEGRYRERAMLKIEERNGSSRELRAVYVTADLEAGLLRTAEALGPLYVIEDLVLPEGGRWIRTAQGERGNASFDATGALVGMTLQENVILKEADLVATCEEAFLDIVQGRAELFGDPVNLENSTGELIAPKVTYSRETGLVHAEEGVRARLQEAAGEVGALPFGDTPDEPVRVESEEAFFRRNPEGFLFRGGVRAWQGNNLLLAEQLRGEQGSRMSASGEVKTIWHPQERREEPAAEEETAPTGGPVEITAEHMSYVTTDGVLQYNGDVKTLQAGRLLSCNEMRVEMEEGETGNRAERMRCNGQAQLDDPQTGRRIDGNRAIYYMTPGELEFFGDPLVLRDPVRGRVEARHLRYRLEDGQLWMGAAAASSQPSG